MAPSGTTTTTIILPIKWIILIAIAVLICGGLTIYCLGALLLFAVIKIFAAIGCAPCVRQIKKWDDEKAKKAGVALESQEPGQGLPVGMQGGGGFGQPSALPQMDAAGNQYGAPVTPSPAYPYTTQSYPAGPPSYPPPAPSAEPSPARWN
ncbi:hypothetical protein HDV00_004779 [Rhizophlyctis rosea]|nr:hypothetical protein HDV00_004779 [Rhizophlyctis rosea]